MSRKTIVTPSVLKSLGFSDSYMMPFKDKFGTSADVGAVVKWLFYMTKKPPDSMYPFKVAL